MTLASSRIALRPSSGRVPACDGHALDEDLEARDALAPGDDLAAVAGGLGDQHVFGLAALGLDQRARGRAADLFIRDVKLRDPERRALGRGAKLPERMIGEIGAALHVVDARTERAVALDPERQPLDEAHRMHGIEMAQHQDARLVLAPCRARHEMIAAAVAPGDALDGGRQVAIAVRDHGRQLVDLLGGFGRRFDLHPAADAVEDGFGVKGIGRAAVFVHAVGYIEKQSMSLPAIQISERCASSRKMSCYTRMRLGSE